MMFHHFAASHNMMEEEQYIIKEACSKESDPNECTMLVKQYWPKVAMKLFTRSNAKMVCGGLDPSCSSSFRYVMLSIYLIGTFGSMVISKESLLLMIHVGFFFRK